MKRKASVFSACLAESSFMVGCFVFCAVHVVVCKHQITSHRRDSHVIVKGWSASGCGVAACGESPQKDPQKGRADARLMCLAKHWPLQTQKQMAAKC